MSVGKLAYQIESGKRRRWKWSVRDGANIIETGRNKGSFSDAVDRAEHALKRLEAVRSVMARK